MARGYGIPQLRKDVLIRWINIGPDGGRPAHTKELVLSPWTLQYIAKGLIVVSGHNHCLDSAVGKKS
jgi:hypothetical protein